MAKSANIYVRIEPELKEKAEEILESLGLPISTAITLFYQQIIYCNGLPFEVKLPNLSLNQEQKDIQISDKDSMNSSN